MSRFRWVTCQLAILRHCLPPSVRCTLEDLPGDLDATYERILEKIPTVNRVYAHRLLQCLSVAARPLEVQEIAEVLAIEFNVMGDIPKLSEDLRWENQEQEAVLSVCSSLVTIVDHHGSLRVQFSHFSVLEFLSSDRLANSESLRYYYIQRESAHTVMAQVCLGALLQLDDHMDKDTIESYPLADYAGEFFVTHAKVGDVLSKISNGIDILLDPNRRHLNTWLWLQSFDWDSQYFDLDPDSSSDFGEQYFDQSISEYPIYPPRVSPLYYTLLFGHTCLAQYLIRNRTRDLCATDICGRTALHIAAFKSDFEVVQMLVDTAHIDVDCQDNRGCTPLHYAMHDGDHESHNDVQVSRCVELLLNRGANVETQNIHGSTPLHLAAFKMSEKVVRSLITNGANINLKNNESQTALHKASRRGHLEIAQLLLDHKANIDLQDNNGSTPLHLAIGHMSREAIRVFLNHGANVTLQNDKGHVVLHQAVRRGHPDIIQLILSGANVDALDNDRSTPLHLAASEAEALSGAQLLLEHGANINVQNNKGQTALHLASQRGRLDFMELLLDHGATVDVLDIDGFTPLHLAISKVERRAAEFLLAHRANINLRNDKSRTVLHRESECGHLIFMEVALGYGADVNAQDNDGVTPLNLAISKSKESAVQLLVKHGAIDYLNMRDEKGQTSLHHLATQIGDIPITLSLYCDMDALDNSGSAPLHLAISELNLQAAELLLDHGADVDMKNSEGQTALHLASQHGSLDSMRVLLENGANVDAKDNYGSTPLHQAVSKAEVEPSCVQLLLDRGASINRPNEKGQTALHLASQHGSLDIMRLLLQKGAQVNAMDKDASTPLHQAVSKADVEPSCIQLLLHRGAKINRLDSKGQTALHLASQHGNLDIMQVLLENGADVDATDNDGSTPLHTIISGTPVNSKSLELLLDHGASAHIENNRGETPFRVATVRGFQEITELLSTHIQSERRT